MKTLAHVISPDLPSVQFSSFLLQNRAQRAEGDDTLLEAHQAVLNAHQGLGKEDLTCPRCTSLQKLGYLRTPAEPASARRWTRV